MPRIRELVGLLLVESAIPISFRTSVAIFVCCNANLFPYVGLQSAAICEASVLCRHSVLQTGVRSRRLSGGWRREFARLTRLLLLTECLHTSCWISFGCLICRARRSSLTLALSFRIFVTSVENRLCLALAGLTFVGRWTYFQ